MALVGSRWMSPRSAAADIRFLFNSPGQISMASPKVQHSAARFGRAALLLPLLFTGACASIPNLGDKPEPRAVSDYASSTVLAGESAEWPADGW